MKRIHGIVVFVMLFTLALTFTFSTDALCAKKNKNKKTAVSENTVTEASADDETSEEAEDTETDENTEDTETVDNTEKTDEADQVSGNAVSGDTVYTKKQKKWLKKVMVDTEEFVPVLDVPNSDGVVIGRMYKNSVAKVKKVGKKYTKIKSGAVKGYILNDDCIYGIDALGHKKELKKENSNLTITGVMTPLFDYTEDDQKLLAALIYCEGGYEIYDGQVAVGAVVMNRMESTLFPDTMEGVIYQKYQFGPASSGLLEKALQSDIKESCLQAAEDAFYGVDPTKGAFYFRRVGYTEGIEIGNHVFF